MSDDRHRVGLLDHGGSPLKSGIDITDGFRLHRLREARGRIRV